MRTISALAVASAVAAALAAPFAGAATQGEKVYGKTCVVCHAEGVSGAPRLGNPAEWAPRVASGKEALVVSVRSGKGFMPARGGNPKFTDEDLRAAVDYMLSKLR